MFQLRSVCEDQASRVQIRDKGEAMAQKTGEFEFKLGRSGLVFFTFVIALVLLFSFVCGVMVGKNIESYPEKIARGIPNVIRKTITERVETGPARTDGNAIASDESLSDPAPDTDQKEETVEFTFYDTLKKTDESAGHETFTPPKAPSLETSSPANKQADGLYTVQVASFRDKAMTGALGERLSHLGYTHRVDEIHLQSSGRWFRLKLPGFATYDEARTAASRVEEEVKGIKCLIIKNRESE